MIKELKAIIYLISDIIIATLISKRFLLLMGSQCRQDGDKVMRPYPDPIQIGL